MPANFDRSDDDWFSYLFLSAKWQDGGRKEEGDIEDQARRIRQECNELQQQLYSALKTLDGAPSVPKSPLDGRQGSIAPSPQESQDWMSYILGGSSEENDIEEQVVQVRKERDELRHRVSLTRQSLEGLGDAEKQEVDLLDYFFSSAESSCQGFGFLDFSKLLLFHSSSTVNNMSGCPLVPVLDEESATRTSQATASKARLRQRSILCVL